MYGDKLAMDSVRESAIIWTLLRIKPKLASLWHTKQSTKL